MTVNPHLSQLRHLLHQRASPALWDGVCALFETWPGAHLALGLDYAGQHLSAWPVALRHAEPEVCRVLLGEGAPPWWPLVRSARINGLTADTLGALLSGRYLREIHTLDLKAGRLGPVGASVIARTRHLGGLRALSLAWNDLRPGGARWLADAGHLRLEALDLQMNTVQSEGVRSIAESATFAQLRRLNVAHNSVGLGGVRALVDSPHTGLLRHLSLAHSDRHDAEINLDLLRLAVTLPELTQLDFSGNPTGPDAAEVLAGIAAPTHLNLHGCKLQDAGVRALANSSNMASLAWLNLAAGQDQIPITDAGVYALAESSCVRGLRHLSLAGTRLGPNGLRALVNAEASAQLGTLILRNTPLGDEGARILAAPHRMTHLHTLDLKGTDISAAGLRALGSGEHLPALRRLSMAANIRLSVDDLCQFLTSPLAAQLHSLAFPNRWLSSIAQERLGDQFPAHLRSDWNEQHEQFPSTLEPVGAS